MHMLPAVGLFSADLLPTLLCRCLQMVMALTCWDMWSSSATTGEGLVCRAKDACTVSTSLAVAAPEELSTSVANVCRSCVRAHKLALMAQRQFWNTLLRDAVPFKDLLVSGMLLDTRAHSNRLSCICSCVRCNSSARFYSVC
jgi:hypothetical protein